MNFKQFFSSQYLFQINSAYISPLEKLFFFDGLALILIAVVLRIASHLAPNPVDAKFRRKFYTLFLTMGVSKVLWYGFRYQNIRFFGSNFVFWLLVLISLVWFVFLVVSVWKHYRPEKEEWEKSQARLKYLPK